MQLSEHFDLEEFTRSRAASVYRIKNVPNDSQLKNLQILCLQVLEPARKITNRPIIITSGYRCPRLNSIVGGRPNSYHTKGMAADIKITGEDEYKKQVETRELVSALMKQPLTDIVLVEHSKTSCWIHVQWSTKPRHHYDMNYKA